jgi:hypothetical protein
MSLTPEQRTLRARKAALTRWSRQDPKEALSYVRDGFLRKFLLQVDPELELPELERYRRAKAALSAHMAGLALLSSKARSKGGST